MDKNVKIIIVIGVIFLICGGFIAYMAGQGVFDKKEDTSKVEATITPTVAPTVKQPEMLPELVEKYNENNDLIGWIKIEGTPIDYPVMFTPGDNEFYLYKDFNKNYLYEGSLYIDAVSKFDEATKCSVPNTNTIIYGHNMKNQTMFGSLKKYAQKSYYDKHPTITFNTLYERGEYEIIGAFYAKVLLKSDTSFRYYKFFEATNEEQFNEFIDYVKSVRKYDTGIEAKYGDVLLTLSTCSSHVENGRFAVVARKKEATSDVAPTDGAALQPTVGN